MKRIGLSLLVASVLALTLAGCSGTLRFIFDIDTNLPQGVTVAESSVSLDSDYYATVDGKNQPVICDDRQTRLTYSFNYTGPLDTYRVVLEGVNSGEQPYVVGSIQNASGGRVAGTITIPAGVAPLAIVPQPKVLGYTRVRIELNPTSSYYLRFNDVPVLATCG